MFSNNFWRGLSTICGISFLFFALTPCHAEDTKIKVGVSVPLSGGLSSWGESIKNSIILADKELDINNNVEFLIEDDQFTPMRPKLIQRIWILCLLRQE